MATRKWTLQFCALADWIPIRIDATITYETTDRKPNSNHIKVLQKGYLYCGPAIVKYAVVRDGNHGSGKLLVLGDQKRYNSDLNFRKGVNQLYTRLQQCNKV